MQLNINFKGGTEAPKQEEKLYSSVAGGVSNLASSAYKLKMANWDTYIGEGS